MADNFSFTEGSGKTGAADDIGGVLYPRVKIAQGADGSATDVSSAAPLQVSLANHGANATAVKTDSSATTQPVSAASLPLPTGAATEATLATRLTESDFDTKVGSLTEAAPASDTASSGLNGRLQRIAQRITSLIALIPAALGQSTMANSFRVVIASDQSALAVGNVATIGTSVVPGTAATNLGKARDSAIGATDTGVAMLGVRRDTPTAETPAAGDYVVPQYSANGEAWVRTQGEIADDATFTVGTTRVQPVGYLADSTSSDSVDEGDIGAARMTLDRRQIVQPYEDLANAVSGAITTAMTGTTSTSLVAAPGAGLRNYITTIIVSNSHATVGTDVIIQDGSGGTTLLTIPAAAVYGGAVITLPMPLRQPTANTALFCANVTTGASTKVSAVGFKAA